MTRHDLETRRLAASLFERGMGREAVAKRLALPRSTVGKWLHTYRSAGIEVLLDMGKNHNAYSHETKLAAARSVVEDGVPKPEAMRRFGIASSSPLDRWCKLYREGGPEALAPKPKGRPKGSKAQKRETTREEELEARVRYLEAENEYLKKLAALKAEKRLRAGRRPRS